MSFRLSCALGLLALVVSPVSAQSSTPADAHEPTDAELAEARHSFEVATQAFDAGDYETAATEFRTALALSGEPDLYFNIYLSEERAGNLPPAAEALGQYLEHGAMDDEQRTLLTGRLERLRARIASHAPAPAVAEEPQALHASPLATAEASPPPDAPPPSPPPRTVVVTSPPIAPIVLMALGGALLVNFGVFAGLSTAENDRLATTCGRSCTSDQVSALNTYDIVADASWIAGATLGVLGLVLFFVLPADSHEEPAPVALAPWLSPQGGGLTIGGRL
ncbi:MAG: hypothetical protein U0234_28045 [Sandaracinus sp.]